MLKQEQKENRNIYLCKLVLIQLGGNPTAFKVWVTNHYDQKCWCVKNTQVLCLLPWLRPAAELELSWITLNIVLSHHLSGYILEKGRHRGRGSRLAITADPHLGKSEGGHITFPNMSKLCSSQDDPKCSNYWLFPLVGDAANKHVEFSEPTSAQLLSLTCGQNKNWNRIYPDKCKGFCLKWLFPKPNQQLWNGEEMNAFLECLNQSEVNILKTRC